MTLPDMLIGIAVAAMFFGGLLWLIERESRKISREYDAEMRRHVSREDQGD